MQLFDRVFVTNDRQFEKLVHNVPPNPECCSNGGVLCGKCHDEMMATNETESPLLIPTINWAEKVDAFGNPNLEREAEQQTNNATSDDNVLPLPVMTW